MSKLKFGWAEQSITPDKKVSLAGQFAERISEYVEKPICVTALAISSETDQAIFCACDLVDISWGLRDAVRAKLAGNDAGLDPMKVIISATHVHTGPRYAHRDDSSSKFTGNATSFRALIESELPPEKKYIESANISANPDIAQPEETFEFLAEQISKAALAAWTSRTEGSFVNAFGRAPVGMCRRVCYNDGSAQMWGNAETAKFTAVEGGNDSGIELMYVFNEKNELTGIVANLACPAQCVQHRLFVSPDFWGEAKMLLRQHFGEHIFLLPQCSAAGDQCPVDLVRWVEPESDVHDPNLKRTNPHKRKADPSMFDLSGMRKAGKRIANEIIEVYNEGLDAPQTDPEFVHEVHMMQLPLRRTTFAEVAAARRRLHRKYSRKPHLRHVQRGDGSLRHHAGGKSPDRPDGGQRRHHRPRLVHGSQSPFNPQILHAVDDNILPFPILIVKDLAPRQDLAPWPPRGRRPSARRACRASGGRRRRGARGTSSPPPRAPNRRRG